MQPDAAFSCKFKMHCQLKKKYQYAFIYEKRKLNRKKGGVEQDELSTFKLLNAIDDEPNRKTEKKMLLCG